jgi:sugar (pentulose or hexulose) kinase
LTELDLGTHKSTNLAVTSTQYFSLMNTIVSTIRQYATEHPVECVTSIVSAMALGLYFSWWKRTEDEDLIEDEDEDVKEIPKQPTQPTPTQTTKAKVERTPP